jgi:uncharacterized damage-inducible protein DinB
MDAKDFLRMFEYDSWANRQCLSAMRGAGASGTSDIAGRMAHILSAQKLWLERILNRPQSLPVWPGSTVEESLALTDEMSSAWRNYIRQFADHRALDHIVKYRNTKGEPWSSRVDDILTHVLFHSAYHRGQIAVQMRASGLTPTPTDFILAVREGFIE